MFNNNRLVLFAVFAGLIALTGCKPKPEKIVVSPENIQLTAPDATATLKATAVDKNGAEVEGVTITWSSSNESVAKVDAHGKVTAVGSGNATITAKAAALSANVAVTVSLPTAIKLDKDKVSVTPEALEVAVTATIVDEKGQPWKGKGEVTWSSADEKIAKVEKGKITGVGEGKTTVTAAYKGLKAEVAVESTVTAEEEEGAKATKSTKKASKKHKTAAKRRGASRRR